MAEFKFLTATNGRILHKGMLRLNGRSVGFDRDYTTAYQLLDAKTFPGKTINELFDMVRRDKTGNITILQIGKGAKALGFNANTWFFVTNGRAYVRLPGNGARGQYFQRGGRWHTRVRPLRGKARAAVLAATA